MFEYHTLVEAHQAEIREAVAQSRRVQGLRFHAFRLPRLYTRVTLQRREVTIKLGLRTSPC